MNFGSFAWGVFGENSDLSQNQIPKVEPANSLRFRRFVSAQGIFLRSSYQKQQSAESRQHLFPNPMQKTSEQLLQLIAEEIWQRQGFNTLALDLKGVSSLSDYCVVSEASADRHLHSLAEAIIKRLKAEGMTPHHIEGMAFDDWIVLDYIDIVVHLFLPAMRRHYCLEEIWKGGRLIDLRLPSEEHSIFEVNGE